MDNEHIVFDVVLLAGRPRPLSLELAPDPRWSRKSDRGSPMTVADIRPSVDGPSQIVCIYAD